MVREIKVGTIKRITTMIGLGTVIKELKQQRQLQE